jgi:hypothetical protein
LASSSWFDVSGEGNAISIFGQDPKEVAKIYGMFLLHSGKLKTYADQNKKSLYIQQLMYNGLKYIITFFTVNIHI